MRFIIWQEPLVDVAPIDPLIDAKEEHIYRDKDYYRAYHIDLVA